MAVAVESSTLKSVPAHYIFSVLIKTVGGSCIPESVADLASLIIGKSRVHMEDNRGDKADHRVAAKADHRVAAKAEHRVAAKADHRVADPRVVAKVVGMADKVKVISPHFFSN